MSSKLCQSFLSACLIDVSGVRCVSFGEKIPAAVYIPQKEPQQESDGFL